MAGCLAKLQDLIISFKSSSSGGVPFSALASKFSARSFSFSAPFSLICRSSASSSSRVSPLENPRSSRSIIIICFGPAPHAPLYKQLIMKGSILLLVSLTALLSLTVAARECIENWQCPSLSCNEGLCEEDFTTNLAGQFGDKCIFPFNCHSGCCQQYKCVPKAFCSFPNEELPSLSDVQTIVKEATDSINFRNIELWGKCDYNFQCGSKCCKNGSCAWFERACNNQKELGEKCNKNDHCGSSCCKGGQCTPIWMCTNAQDQDDDTACKYNDQCKSGCCMFYKCRENNMWCSAQSPKGEKCAISGECLTNCCKRQQCVDTFHCYTAGDYLRESDPRMAIFYNYMFEREAEEEAAALGEQTMNLAQIQPASELIEQVQQIEENTEELNVVTAPPVLSGNDDINYSALWAALAFTVLILLVVVALQVPEKTRKALGIERKGGEYQQLEQ